MKNSRVIWKLKCEVDKRNATKTIQSCLNKATKAQRFANSTNRNKQSNLCHPQIDLPHRKQAFIIYTAEPVDPPESV